MSVIAYTWTDRDDPNSVLRFSHYGSTHVRVHVRQTDEQAASILLPTDEFMQLVQNFVDERRSAVLRRLGVDYYRTEPWHGLGKKETP